MRIKKGFAKRPLAEKFIVVAEDVALVDFSKVVALNGTASYLWDEVSGRDFTEEELAELLTSRYGIDSETASSEAHNFVTPLKENGIVE